MDQHSSLLLAYSDYLTAELRLSDSTIAVYTLEARLFLRYAAGEQLEMGAITTANLIEYLVGSPGTELEFAL